MTAGRTVVLGVPDPETWRAGLAAVPDTQVVGVADTLRAAARLVGDWHPHLVVLDDRLLQAQTALWTAVAAWRSPRVVVAATVDAAVAQRALAIQARTVLDYATAQATWPAVLAQYAAAPDAVGPAPLVAVFAPKGGVGKTTLAANLAWEFALLPQATVALVDLDLACGDIATVLGLRPRATLADATAGADAALVDRLLTPTPRDSLHVLAAPLTPQSAEEVLAETVASALLVLRDGRGAVVADTAPGFGDITLTALDAATVILVVVTPDVVALRSTRQALDVLRSGLGYPPDKVRVILNRAGTGTGINAEAVADALDQPVWATLPSDGATPVQAANQGRALRVLQPTSPLVSAVHAVASRLWAEWHGPVRRRTRSWWPLRGR